MKTAAIPRRIRDWRTVAAAAVGAAGIAAAVMLPATPTAAPTAHTESVGYASQGGCLTYDARGLSGFNIGVCINDRATGAIAYPDIYVNTARRLGVRESCRIDIETWDDHNHQLGDTSTDCATGPHRANPVKPSGPATVHAFARLWFDGSPYWTGNSREISLTPNAGGPRVGSAAPVHAITISANPGLKVYRTPDLSGTPLGTINRTSVTATCRTPGIGIQILYPGGAAGIGYIAAPPTVPGTLITCPAPPAGKTGSTGSTGSTGQSTAAQCVAQDPNDVLFSEFIKNWILNNGQTWASDLSALGDTNPPTSDSQIVTDALAKASRSLYDENSAFASAVKTALQQESLTTYPDCNDQADGEQAQWKKDLFNRLADQVTKGLLKAAVQQIENSVAKAGSQTGGQQKAKNKDQNGCDTDALTAALHTLPAFVSGQPTTGYGIDAGGTTYWFQSTGFKPFLINGRPWRTDDRQLSGNAVSRLRGVLGHHEMAGFADHAEPKMAEFMYEQRRGNPSVSHVCAVINNPQGPCPYPDTAQPVGCRNVVPLLLATGQEMDVYWQPTPGGPLTSIPFPGTAKW